eukprot:1370287-Pyramimonas_sp.AAC.1
MAKNIDKALHIESRAARTNKGSDYDANFQPKCRIVGKGFQEKCDEKLRSDSPTRSPSEPALQHCSMQAVFMLYWRRYWRVSARSQDRDGA